MKNIKTFGLAILAVIAMFYLGMDGISQRLSFGPFFIFVGSCTTIGLSIDIINHIRTKIRRANVRKLGH